MPKQKPMQWVLPEVVNPPDTVCFQINVPNERHHIGAFFGAIYLLSKPYAWGDDPDHTAIEVGAVWRRIFDNLIAGNCTIPAKPGSAGADGGDENLIRQNPDNPCELQTSINGVDWCTFADISLCVGGSPQPGAGSPQPPAGGCQSYRAVFPASTQWLLPTIVNTGDTLEVSNLSGVTNDGGSLDWRCPDGDLFFAGACAGSTFLNGTDPLPTVPHMRVIAQIGTSFYDVINGVFTVPSGITNAQVSFQVNDDPISNDQGQIAFDVNVCNNASAAWSHTFNFTANDGGFQNIVYPSGNPTATWVATSGWEANQCTVISSVSVYTILALFRDFAPSTVTGFSMTYDAVLGANPAGDTTRVSLRNGGGDNFIINEAPRNGSGLTDSWTGSISGVTTLLIFPIFAFADGGGSCDTTPEITLTSITISGVGTDPF